MLLPPPLCAHTRLKKRKCKMQNAKRERAERQARLNTMPSERSISAADKNAKALCRKK